MAAPVYNVVTVLDEIRGALSWAGSDSKLTDVEIERFIYENIESAEGTYNFQKITTGLYKHFHGRPFGLFILFKDPTTPFTGVDDVVYTVNCRGSIKLTTGTTTVTSIEIVGVAVDFSATMVQLLHWLATHRCQEISASVGGFSMSPTGVKAELISMAEYWTGIVQLA